MQQYFTLRPTTRNDDPKRTTWLFNELQAGRLRQGWLNEVSLVDAHGRLVPKALWIQQARAAVRDSDWATKRQMKIYKKPGWCPEKYAELRLMTELEEGDVIVVLGLFDKREHREGFVLATARRAPAQIARRRNCYWYEANGDQGWRHVVSVRTTMPQPRYDFVWEKRSKPVQRIQDEELVRELEAVRGGAEPPITKPLPKFKLIGKQREKINAQIAARQGQPEFRRKLLLAYGRRCAISGCDVEEVLEAAHVVPHSQSPTDDERNGILLRADLHTLLDKGLLGIKPSTRTVEIHPDLRQTPYRKFEGRPIQKTNPPDRRPDPKVLEQQYAWFQEMVARLDRVVDTVWT
jgi:hypothetical protein